MPSLKWFLLVIFNSLVILLDNSFLSILYSLACQPPGVVQTIILLQIIGLLDVQEVSLAPGRLGHQVLVGDEVDLLARRVNVVHMLHLHEHGLGLFQLLLVQLVAILVRQVNGTQSKPTDLVSKASS